MAITVEDGTQVAGANSYCTADDLREFADLRGIALGSDDPTLEILLIKAMDYIESFRDRFQGCKTDTTQELQFPRTGLFIDGAEIDGDAIPKELRNAQMQAALEVQDYDLQPNQLPSTSGAVIEETVGELTFKYDKVASATTVPKFRKVDAFIAPLLTKLRAVSIRT